jgi:hypothetical protein
VPYYYVGKRFAIPTYGSVPNSKKPGLSLEDAKTNSQIINAALESVKIVKHGNDISYA